MNSYTIEYTRQFNEDYKREVRKNKEIKKRIDKAILLLSNDPNYPSLKSHKVNTTSNGTRWSSWVTGDLRIIWDYDEDGKLILPDLST